MIIYLFEAIHLFLEVLHLMRLLHCHLFVLSLKVLIVLVKVV